MRKKGRLKVETPEKMPIPTAGIQLTRGGAGDPKPTREKLTGGNQPADESEVAKLVTDYISKGML